MGDIMKGLNVLVVDDSSFYRRIIISAIERIGPNITIQSECNGIDAIKKIKQFTFDIVLLDVNMPGMNGIETLIEIKKFNKNLTVIMISGAEKSSAHNTIDALEAGAIDFILKPQENDLDKNISLIQSKLEELFTQIEGKARTALRPKNPTSFNIKQKFSRFDLVVLASSTGGPSALDKFFRTMPNDFTVPILIVQHMPPLFTKSLSESLSRKTHYKVIEGKEGDIIVPGQAIIAPGGFHMYVDKGKGNDKVITIKGGETVNGVKPAADVLFASVAKEYAGKNVLAIVLTGMGCDGAKGIIDMKKTCNVYTLCQSQESCVVYGMPRCVVEKRSK